ncbi:MAG: cytochrome C oxidase subunit IV family protein [Planctomycetota bacterium]|nr:cytochrome C oxidase subunit IV family protein [Planctomycetota bacterium]
MSHDNVGHADHADSGHGHDQSHGGLGKYLIVGGLLAVLTAISFAAGSSKTIMSTPQLGWTIMIAVSCAKAMLVMLFFMHLIWEANWKYVLTVPASIMSLFLMLMLVPDVGLRTRNYSEERLLRAATPAAADSNSPSEEAEMKEGDTPTDGHKQH